MGVGIEGHPPDTAHELEERRVAGHVGPQHEEVGEEADQALDFGPRAVRDRSPHRDVVLSAVAPEQGGERGQQRHERRDALPLAQGPDAVDETGGEHPDLPGAVEALHRWTRPVRGKLQRGEPLQLPPPVGKMPLEPRSLQPLPLPRGVVRVLDRELREGGRPALAERLVQGPQLPSEHLHRPTVGDDVVRAQHEAMVVLAEPQQAPADEGPLGKAERTLGLDDGQPLDLGGLLGRRESAEVQHFERARPGRDEAQFRLAPDLYEADPQGFVAAQDLVEAPREGRDSKRPREAQSGEHVVSRAVGLQLVQEPQAPLGKGERDLLRVGPARDRFTGRSLDPPLPEQPREEGALLRRQTRRGFLLAAHRA